MFSSEGSAACIERVQNLIGPGKVVAEVVQRRVRVAPVGPFIEIQRVFGSG
jgi:hypothetical protein